MINFTTLIAEQRFVLKHVSEVSADALDDDTIASVLEGAAKLASTHWEPINRIGDTKGAKWTKDGVRMPEGFGAAYSAYVEAG